MRKQRRDRHTRTETCTLAGRTGSLENWAALSLRLKRPAGRRQIPRYPQSPSLGLSLSGNA